VAFVRTLAKSVANSDKDTAVRQSTRHKEDIYANTSASHKEVAGKGNKKARRVRVDIPDGKRGATIFRLIGIIKAERQQRTITE
jgi:hypothetical protein